MHSISELRAVVEKELSGLQFGDKPEALYEPVKYMMQLPAKRMRPVLALMGCELFGGDIFKAMGPAMGIEVFHNFTLLHDDIMDNAPLRRSMQTVHTKWNSNVAILSGDTMFVKACQLMIRTDESYIRKVLELFHKTAIEVCEGQQMDMDFENSVSVTLDDYIGMITLKTAVLLGCALKTGAMIAGAGESDCNNIYDFGVNTGIAFQLKDDILDVYGDDSRFGKKKGGDIIAGKKTYLWLKCMELADPATVDSIKKIISDGSVADEKKVEFVTSAYDRLGVRVLAESEMENYYNKALSNLESINTPAGSKEQLREFAGLLMVREV